MPQDVLRLVIGYWQLPIVTFLRAHPKALAGDAFDEWGDDNANVLEPHEWFVPPDREEMPNFTHEMLVQMADSGNMPAEQFRSTYRADFGRLSPPRSPLMG